MLRVLYLSERHGVVTPRSNSATIYSIPLRAPDIDPQTSYEIWQQIKSDLPDYTLMPTAVGFCMLIKAEILQRFGLFDEIYSPGYNEENDFVCRINRFGFSAVAANHAFVYHYESSSFGSERFTLERTHREILLDRYPEYQRTVAGYLEMEVDPVERFSILRAPHRKTILYDLIHLPAIHAGTSEFALNLLRDLHPLLENDYDVFIGLGEEGRFFLTELNGYRLFEDRPSSTMVFDLVFKPAQIFTWADFRRLHKLSPRVAFTLLDVIALRCNYLSCPEAKTIYTYAMGLSDQVFTISNFSHTDVNDFFHRDFPAKAIHLGTNYGLDSAEFMQGEYVLLMGNKYAHKAVKDALKHLLDVGPLAVLGSMEEPANLPPHVRWLSSGGLTRRRVRELVARASTVVYPSHYEGFGLPIVDALALGKRVIAINTEVNRELAEALNNPNLSLIESLQSLAAATKASLEGLSKTEPAPPPSVRTWKEVAADYAVAFHELLAKEQDTKKLRGRQEVIRLLDSAKHI
jgi:glycosyltransferase involved in cell wall biosynthesis